MTQQPSTQATPRRRRGTCSTHTAPCYPRRPGQMEWGTDKVGSLQNEVAAANKEKDALEANLKAAGEETSRLRSELKAAQDAAQKRQKEVSALPWPSSRHRSGCHPECSLPCSPRRASVTASNGAWPPPGGAEDAAKGGRRPPCNGRTPKGQGACGALSGETSTGPPSSLMPACYASVFLHLRLKN